MTGMGGFSPVCFAKQKLDLRRPAFRLRRQNQNAERGLKSIMPTIPSGTESVRAFVPASDFGLSKRFYETLGFTKLLDGDVAIFGIGSSCFILLNGFQQDTGGNFMMQLMVDDLDSWWTYIGTLDLAAAFGVAPPKPPAMQPWGLRVAYVVDPAGVLWHIAERREGNIAD